MKFGIRYYLLFLYFESSLTYKRDKFLEIRTSDQQASTQAVSTCQIRDLNLPRNGDKWFCSKTISGDSELVPKNAKCYLQCKEGYDVRSRKFIGIILRFLFILSNQIIGITLNVQLS